MEKKQSWLLRFIKGIVIAVGFIIPGVSGGALAAIFGLYERMLRFLANVRTRFKKDFPFFLPVGIGGILGIGLLSAPLDYLLAHHTLIVLWGFVGAIIGTLPSLFKEATNQYRRDFLDWLWLIVSAIGGFFFFYFLEDMFGTIAPNFFGFIIAGAVIAIGILVPGLSSAALLLVLGLYDPMLTGFRNFELASTFLPIAIGGLLAMLLFSKFMSFLITRFHSRVYHFIIGLVFASTALIVMPPVADYSGVEPLTIVLAVVAFIVGGLLGQLLCKLEAKSK